ncbi:MAG TPA: SUMF1/EgtB/PvdO family nonheme iron enzyme [Polyangiaceae bacterium]|nr:SUMF1/EgtB/PvdO family nonheme iron enzyme [Polyangiaceae bacterium]
MERALALGRSWSKRTLGVALLMLGVGSPGTHASSRAAAGTEARDAGARVVWLRAPEPPMVRIPAGEFIMGSTPEEALAAVARCASEPLGHRCNEQTFANELPRRRMTLPDFWMDRTEVSVREYRRCVAHGSCSRPAFAAGGRRFDRDELPVTLVSWEEAAAFCRFRSARLPTEAEWERAARGRNGRTYPWGNLYNSRVHNHGRLGLLPEDGSDGFGELAPAGVFPGGRTPEGLLDLGGNAAEWVADYYREHYLDTSSSRGSTRRSVRGGSFTSGAAWIRGAARDSAPADARRPQIGFRCAKTDEPANPL